VSPVVGFRVLTGHDCWFLTVLLSCRKLISPRVSGKRDLVPTATGLASVSEFEDGRTRRWGKRGGSGGVQTPINNHFAQVAPIWFYSLMGNFVERKDDVVLWGDEIGATLLANLFLTLGRIVWCAGPNTLGVDILAKDLFDLIWPFRTAEIGALRHSVLCSAGMVVGFLRQETILSLLLDRSDSALLPNLHLLSDDPDSDCRSASQALMRLVTSTFESISQPNFLN
jgi:hypothetical protein